MKSHSPIAGILLIAFGALLLAQNFNVVEIPWAYLRDSIFSAWPLALLGLSGLFWMRWFANRSNVAPVFPAVVFLVYGSLFYYCSLHGWWMMGGYDLWAFFIIGPGLGFLAMYVLGKRDGALLFSGLAITSVGLLFLLDMSEVRLLWPLLIILIGMRLLLRGRRNLKRQRAMKQDSAS
ncbi:MAG: hypothetical protein ACRBF0_13285 [Calditrichia bacterium]